MDSISNWENTGWGSKDGKAVHISEVERGLACECVCPSCGEKLVARKGNVRLHHFAHAQKVDCSSLGESALHLACKNVIAETCEILLPQVVASDGIYQGGRSYYPQGYDVVASSKRVQFDTVELECSLGRIVPDVAASSKGHTLCIEIKVTHAVNDDKALYYERLKMSAIEIDVSELPRDASKEKVRQCVIESESHKKWIYNAKAAIRLARCTRKDCSGNLVPCPLPTMALLDNLPKKGWNSAAKRAAYKGEVYWLKNCLYCKHALCFFDEHLYCDATPEATSGYTKFPGGF